MQLLRYSNQMPLEFTPELKLGGGGEGVIYRVRGERALAAKVYHNPTAEQGDKLLAMFKHPPDDPMHDIGHASIAWPVDLLTSPETNEIVGFLMPFASDTFRAMDLFVPRSRLEKCPLFTYQYLHRTARNIAAAMDALHAAGVVVGDVNESNMLVTREALATLVDTDSFQIRDSSGKLYRCGVGKPEFTPPELQGFNLREVNRTPEHDRFGLAALIFQLLMEGAHPFSGQYHGEGDPPSIEARIKAGEFPFGNASGSYSPPPNAPSFDILNPALCELFITCFQTGHVNPGKRPSASQWYMALQAAESDLKKCRKNSQHRYGAHLKRCPWCERAEKLGGRDYFPSRLALTTGAHLKKPALKQAPLPAVAASSGRRMSHSSVKRPGSFSSRVNDLLDRWDRSMADTPTRHVSFCAFVGALVLGGIRLASNRYLPSMHGWMKAMPAITAPGGLRFALASVCCGSFAALFAMYTWRRWN